MIPISRVVLWKGNVAFSPLALSCVDQGSHVTATSLLLLCLLDFKQLQLYSIHKNLSFLLKLQSSCYEIHGSLSRTSKGFAIADTSKCLAAENINQFIFQIQEVNRHVNIREKQPLRNCSFSSLRFLYKDNANTTILQIVQIGKVRPYI